MSIKQLIERNTTLSILSLLLAGFIAGISTYDFILKTANLDKVQKGSYITHEELERNYILKNKIKDILNSPYFYFKTLKKY